MREMRGLDLFTTIAFVIIVLLYVVALWDGKNKQTLNIILLIYFILLGLVLISVVIGVVKYMQTKRNYHLFVVLFGVTVFLAILYYILWLYDTIRDYDFTVFLAKAVKASAAYSQAKKSAQAESSGGTLQPENEGMVSAPNPPTESPQS